MGQYHFHLCNMVLWVFLSILLFIALFNIKVDKVGIGSLPVRTALGKVSHLSAMEAGVIGIPTIGGSWLTSLDWLELTSLGWLRLGSSSFMTLSPIIIWGFGSCSGLLGLADYSILWGHLMN